MNLWSLNMHYRVYNRLPLNNSYLASVQPIKHCYNTSFRSPNLPLSSTESMLKHMLTKMLCHGATVSRGSRFPLYRGCTITVTPHSKGLLWTSDQTDAETSTRQHTTLTTDKTSVHPVRFEPAIPASERLQINALDRWATGIGTEMVYCSEIDVPFVKFLGFVTIKSHQEWSIVEHKTRERECARARVFVVCLFVWP